MYMSMTASLHKLAAGSGYDSLTRQVAAQDSTEKGHASLVPYFSGKGEDVKHTSGQSENAFASMIMRVRKSSEPGV